MDQSFPQKCRQRNDRGKLRMHCHHLVILNASNPPQKHFSDSLLHSQDSTFEFEKRRNRPIRYNRETMESTLRAMKAVSDIRHKRQDMFFKMRMRAHKGIQREQVRAEIKKGVDILAPAAADREKAIAIASKKIIARQRTTEGKMEN